MNKINYIIDEIADQYMLDDNNRPWIIGFSGGKDSTVLLTLTWMAILKVKNEYDIKFLKREVYVVCNDTLVENPIITNYVNKVLGKIADAASLHSLPIKVRKTTPRLEDSFFVNLIGKGYPAPNNSFRWCTERLKIKPTSKFISDIVRSEDNDYHEAIVLVGTRKSESITRANSIKKHEIRGKRLTKHPLQNNVFVYSPIKELELEEVWYIINTFTSPWGADNKELFDIYADASADDYECPTMVSDKEHKSCGQSRFGCWTCTVVKEDKSISAQIENGYRWLIPLRDLRNWIQEERNKPENRSDYRRDGSLAAGPNLGCVKIKHRVEMLEKVFTPVFRAEDLHKQPNHHAITTVLMNGMPSAPFTMSLPAPMGKEDRRVFESLREYSAKKYGRPGAEVDKEIDERLNINNEEKKTSTSTPSAGEGGGFMSMIGEKKHSQGIDLGVAKVPADQAIPGSPEAAKVIRQANEAPTRELSLEEIDAELARLNQENETSDLDWLENGSLKGKSVEHKKSIESKQVNTQAKNKNSGQMSSGDVIQLR